MVWAAKWALFVLLCLLAICLMSGVNRRSPVVQPIPTKTVAAPEAKGFLNEPKETNTNKEVATIEVSLDPVSK